MDSETITINPPIYLAYTKTSCWQCQAMTSVVCFLAPNVSEEPGEVFSLSRIEELPDPVRESVQSRFPKYKPIYSNASESQYYGNTCHHCDVLQGDYHLHCEPGAAFFPETIEDARQISVEELIIEHPIEMVADIGIGNAEFILEHGKRTGGQ